MPQHLWRGDQKAYRVCEACRAPQYYKHGEWLPPLSPICPGDEEDDNSRRGPRRRPSAPSGPLRVREFA